MKSARKPIKEVKPRGEDGVQEERNGDEEAENEDPKGVQKPLKERRPRPFPTLRVKPGPLRPDRTNFQGGSVPDPQDNADDRDCTENLRHLREDGKTAPGQKVENAPREKDQEPTCDEEDSQKYARGHSFLGEEDSNKEEIWKRDKFATGAMGRLYLSGLERPACRSVVTLPLTRGLVYQLLQFLNLHRVHLVVQRICSVTEDISDVPILQDSHFNIVCWVPLK